MILVTFTSRSNSNFEQSNISLKENKQDGVDYNSKMELITTLTVSTIAFGRMKEEFDGFRQTVKANMEIANFVPF